MCFISFGKLNKGVDILFVNFACEPIVKTYLFKSKYRNYPEIKHSLDIINVATLQRSLFTESCGITYITTLNITFSLTRIHVHLSRSRNATAQQQVIALLT